MKLFRNFFYAKLAELVEQILGILIGAVDSSWDLFEYLRSYSVTLNLHGPPSVSNIVPLGLMFPRMSREKRT